MIVQSNMLKFLREIPFWLAVFDLVLYVTHNTTNNLCHSGT